MPIEALSMLKSQAGWVLRKFGALFRDKLSRRRARIRAAGGEPLAEETSLQHIVEKELEKLARQDDVPASLSSGHFRRWIANGDNVGPLVEVLIAYAGKRPELARQAEEMLEADYCRITHASKSLATGQIEYVVSHIHGQLAATDSGRQALSLALVGWQAVQLLSDRNRHLRVLTVQEIARVRNMAAMMLEAGRRNWKMPRFVAPLSLELHEHEEGRGTHATTATGLSSFIENGESLVVFGPGGIGKTTFLLELCTAMAESSRIPLYVDAVAWARSGAGLYEFAAQLPAGRLYGIQPDDLSRLAADGKLALMLNGWNELSTASRLFCNEQLLQSSVAAPALNLVVTSRASSDFPPLLKSRRVEVRGLNWNGQSAVIRAELGDEASRPVLDLLAKDTRLRHAARSPLILRGVIAQANREQVGFSSVFDLLGVTIHDFEDHFQRRAILTEEPVRGEHAAYLEELACELTNRGSTNCSRHEALRAIHSAVSFLLQKRLIAAAPNIHAVLDVLIGHHLLYEDESGVRFVHQRFQEYFAAARLLRECTEEDDRRDTLKLAVRGPAWDEALALVAGKLKATHGNPNAKSILVQMAGLVDLGLACDLVGFSGLNAAESPGMVEEIRRRVTELRQSSLGEVRKLGVAYQKASALAVFADEIWALLESDNQQTRLNTHRLNGTAIALSQLGWSVAERIGRWPTQRRVEFVHEISENPDNYDFVVNIARTERDHSVRAAAISALFWHFPASDAAAKAWLESPVEVQLEKDVLAHVQDAVEDENDDLANAVKERLKAISEREGPGSPLHERWIGADLDKIGPHSLEAIFHRLRTDHQHEERLVTAAQTAAPRRLLELAEELVLKDARPPEWVSRYLDHANEGTKTGLFERLWVALTSTDRKAWPREVWGKLANVEQIERSVAFIVDPSWMNRTAYAELDRERRRHVENMLLHASGDALFDVVMRRAPGAEYRESTELLDLILRRIGGEEGGRAHVTTQWKPSIDQLRRLIASFSEKSAPREVLHDAVYVTLCRIASYVSPEQFVAFIVEGCRRQLDAWSEYRARMAEWSLERKRGVDRPSNPQYGLILLSAAAKCGFDALPGLLALIAHPQAANLVPEGIAQITLLPWAGERRGWFHNSVSFDIVEGEKRRRARKAFRQPDEALQPLTDQAAHALGQEFGKLLDAYANERAKNAEWDDRQAAYQIGRMAAALAKVPSELVTEPLERMLANGVANSFGTLDVLRGLVRQGWLLSDPKIVEQLELLHARVVATWHDNSSRYVVSELSQLLVCMAPTALLTKTKAEYIDQWAKASHLNEVIRSLGSTKSDAAWSALVEIGSRVGANGKVPEELFHALIETLTPDQLPRFIDMVGDGTLLRWCRDHWTIKRLASNIAEVFKRRPDQIDLFVDACRGNGTSLADTLVCNALSHIKGAEDMRILVLVEALDANRVDRNAPTYETIRGMFSLKTPIGESTYEVSPRASNRLRSQIYARAKGVGPVADTCKRMLASLESDRRESGRPIDETRHPAEDGAPWTDVFKPASAEAKP